jgi:hypothetical protein
MSFNAERTPSNVKERRNAFPSVPLGRLRISQAGSSEGRMSDGDLFARPSRRPILMTLSSEKRDL